MNSYEIICLINNIVNNFEDSFNKLDNHLDILSSWIDQDVEEIVFSDNFDFDCEDANYMEELIYTGSFKFSSKSEFYKYFLREGWEVKGKLCSKAAIPKEYFERLNSCLKNANSLKGKRITKIHDSFDKEYINYQGNYINSRYNSILSKYINIFASKVKKYK
jgi:hypothetical protein